MKREFLFFVIVAVAIVVTLQIAGSKVTKLKEELKSLIELKSKFQTDELAKLREAVDIQRRDIQGLREDISSEKQQTSVLSNSLNKTSGQLAELLNGSHALRSWQVVEAGEGENRDSEVICKKGEIFLSMAQGNAPTRTLSLSAGGIHLQNQTRTVEISERGITVYENIKGQRLGKVIWQTDYAAPVR